MSKGDSPRPVDAQKYRENWERIFWRPFKEISFERKPDPLEEALEDLTRMSQEDGLYGPTEGT